MKLNSIERLVVNNPLRRAGQFLEMQWFSRRLPVSPGARILEIGCGRGAGGQLIIEKFSPDLLCLMDLDIQMVSKARNFLSAIKVNNISYLNAGATFLPFNSHTFDAIFGFGFLHHVLEWQHSITEIARVLRPGGTYYMEELYPEIYQNMVTRHLLVHPETNRFDSLDLINAIKNEGLDIAHKLEIKKVGILAIIKKNGGQEANAG
jgi:ubiquinone/menaquinone biosynthesis C-methylase UbiE